MYRFRLSSSNLLVLLLIRFSLAWYSSWFVASTVRLGSPSPNLPLFWEIYSILSFSSPYLVSKNFSNTANIFSKRVSSPSTVLLAFVTLLTTSDSISWILARWSLSSFSILAYLPKTPADIPSTISLSFLFYSVNIVCWWDKEIKFCSFVPLIISFIVTRPSWTWPIILCSLSKASFSSVFNCSCIFINFDSKYCLKSSSFFSLSSVSDSIFLSNRERILFVLFASESNLSSLIFSDLYFCSSDSLNMFKYSSLWILIFSRSSFLIECMNYCSSIDCFTISSF